VIDPVYYNDIPVGAVCSRIEKGQRPGEACVYIMTMGVLAVRVFHYYLIPSSRNASRWHLASVPYVSVCCMLLLRVQEQFCIALPCRVGGVAAMSLDKSESV
jgi:hypothetical protein